MLDKNDVRRAITAAQSEISRLEQKISNIDAHIAQLKADRDNVSALIEYIELEDRRKDTLRELFQFDDSYVALPPLLRNHTHHEYLNRRAQRDQQIKSLEAKRKQREEAIAFVKKDIDLLLKAEAILENTIALDSLLIDS